MSINIFIPLLILTSIFAFIKIFKTHILNGEYFIALIKILGTSILFTAFYISETYSQLNKLTEKYILAGMYVAAGLTIFLLSGYVYKHNNNIIRGSAQLGKKEKWFWIIFLAVIGIFITSLSLKQFLFIIKYPNFD